MADRDAALADPSTSTAPGRAGDATAATLPPVRAVLVDDDPRFLELIERHLRELPRRVTVTARCRDGRDALAAVEHNRPDLVLLDLAMPDMHGLELLRHLRSVEPPPRVVIVSLHADPFYREACEELGAHGFVAKAELGTELEPTLARVLRRGWADQGRRGAAPEFSRREGEPGTRDHHVMMPRGDRPTTPTHPPEPTRRAAPGEPDAPRRRVLAIEDDEAVGRLIERILDNAGFEVAWARSLAEARHRLRRAPFDLVLADFNLPDGHGTEAVADLPAAEAPALVLTSGYGTDHVRSLGVAPEIPVVDKPFSRAVLLAAVEAALHGG